MSGAASPAFSGIRRGQSTGDLVGDDDDVVMRSQQGDGIVHSGGSVHGTCDGVLLPEAAVTEETYPSRRMISRMPMVTAIGGKSSKRPPTARVAFMTSVSGARVTTRVGESRNCSAVTLVKRDSGGSLKATWPCNTDTAVAGVDPAHPLDEPCDAVDVEGVGS